MIIYLTGADFSGEGNHIATLSTWRISKTIGENATYLGPKEVAHDAELNATVTIDEGYEVGTAGVTVTMGGNAVTSGISQSGNVITISIASVTGNVVIKVPTKAINVEPETTYYTVTYNYVDSDGATIHTATTEQVAAGTTMNFATSNAPDIDGYTVSSVSLTSATINKDTTVTYTYTANETGEPTNYTFTINPDPSTATVTLTASGYTQNGNGITVANGTKVNWSVSADGYTKQTGTWTANGSDESKTVLLNTKINTPPASDAPSGNLASPLININMADGTNIGAGGATYNASAIMDGAFSNNTFTCSNATGAMTVPIDFITGTTSEFTAYMVFDSWEYSDARYQRFFRCKGDEPALYISHSYKMPTGGYTGAQHKLLNAGLKVSNLEYRDEDYWLEISEGAAVCMDMEALSKPLAVAIRNDGVRYSFWVNGKCISTQLLTGKPASPDWSEFQIGSGDDSGYNLQSLTCSKLMIWDKPLSDEEMATLLPN